MCTATTSGQILSKHVANLWHNVISTYWVYLTVIFSTKETKVHMLESLLQFSLFRRIVQLLYLPEFTLHHDANSRAKCISFFHGVCCEDGTTGTLSTPNNGKHLPTLLLFLINNRGCFVSNNEYHNINTREKNDLHLPQVSRTIYQKGVHYSALRFLTVFPGQLKTFPTNLKSLKFL